MKYLFTIVLIFSSFIFSESRNPYVTWYGDPDLQGVWTNATLTTLERPRHFKTLEVSAEEAESAAKKAAAESFAYDNEYKQGETPRKGRDVGGYNAAWMDPGLSLIHI